VPFNAMRLVVVGILLGIAAHRVGGGTSLHGLTSLYQLVQSWVFLGHIRFWPRLCENSPPDIIWLSQ
jgi:hypothetical protein